MDGLLARDGVDMHSTSLRAWCSAVWSAVVDLLSKGVKIEDVEKMWRPFDQQDTPTAGSGGAYPDRETWGLLPEHVAGQARAQAAMRNTGGA